MSRPQDPRPRPRLVDCQNEWPPLRAERLVQSDVLLELPPRLRRYDRVHTLKLWLIGAATAAVGWIVIAAIFVVFG
jgi:hypothetical protein